MADKAILIGFKVDENQFEVFQIVSNTARLLTNVSITPDATVCDCAMYKFESKCDHERVVRTDLNTWTEGGGVEIDSDGVIPWRTSSPLTYAVVLNLPKGENSLGAVSPRIGDVSLHNLLWLLDGKDPDTSCLEAKERPFNPARIYAECQASLRLKKASASPEVRDAGASAVRPGDAPEDTTDEEFLPPTPTSPVDPVDPVEGFGEPAEIAKSATDEVKARMEELAADRPTPLYKTIRRPHPSEFFVSKDDWEEICYTILTPGENLLLVGPSGSGKSQVLHFVSRAVERELAAFNCGAMSEPRTSLIGNVGLNEAGTYVSDARFVQAYRGDLGNSIIMLDELTRAVPAAFNILLPALDSQRYIALDEHDDASIVNMGEGVSITATANIGMEYTGTEALDKALKDRFSTIIEMFFPPEANEVTILTGRCKGLKRVDAVRLVKIAVRQRELTRGDQEFPEFISTRMLLATGRKLADGMRFDLACRGSILCHFSDEGGEESDRTKVLQIIQKGDIG